MQNDTKIKYPDPPPLPDCAFQIGRRERTFPMWFINDPVRGQVMLYDHEYNEWNAKVEAWRRECEAIDAAVKAAREAELAAGRPPSNSSDASPEPVADTANSTLAHYRSALARSPETYVSTTVPPDLARHALMCKICSHPDRDAIEGDFVRWVSPIKIAEDYGINDRRNIYRHAHATGLFERRTREVARILEQYMELVDHHLPGNPEKFDFDTVTRAVRVYAHLTPGLWFEPIRTHQILTGPIHPQVQSLAPDIEDPSKMCDVPPARTKRPSRPRPENAIARKTSKASRVPGKGSPGERPCKIPKTELVTSRRQNSSQLYENKPQNFSWSSHF